MAEIIDFSDRRFRSDFEAEKKRILTAIKECESTDKELTQTLGELRVGMARVRGAASLVVRLTEQLISNRNQRLSLIKELRALKRDVLEREIRLAEKAVDIQSGKEQNGVTAELLSRLQLVLSSVPGGAPANLLEPIQDPDALIAGRLVPVPASAPEPDAPDALPEDIHDGDTVSDASGQLWTVTPDGAEPSDLAAAEVFPDGIAGSPPCARLEDGSYVLVVEVG